MSLVDALNFIKKNSDKSYEVGVVQADIPGLSNHKKGDIVIFQTHDPSKASDEERAYWDCDRSGDPVTLTVEAPYSPERIYENLAKGNLIMSHSTVICVPHSYVKKIKYLDSVL